MAHLVCQEHRRRVFTWMEDGQWDAMHRSDGTLCEGDSFEIGGQVYDALGIAHREMLTRETGVDLTVMPSAPS